MQKVGAQMHVLAVQCSWNLVLLGFVSLLQPRWSGSTGAFSGHRGQLHMMLNSRHKDQGASSVVLLANVRTNSAGNNSNPDVEDNW